LYREVNALIEYAIGMPTFYSNSMVPGDPCLKAVARRTGSGMQVAPWFAAGWRQQRLMDIAKAVDFLVVRGQACTHRSSQPPATAHHQAACPDCRAPRRKDRMIRFDKTRLLL